LLLGDGKQWPVIVRGRRLAIACDWERGDDAKQL
jgi:hypothetical protein